VIIYESYREKERDYIDNRMDKKYISKMEFNYILLEQRSKYIRAYAL
jgi:hypothetical protein